jgi:hypothetical protein
MRLPARGGMLDVAGVDISSAPLVVSSIKTVVNAARQASVPIVYVVEVNAATDNG